MGVHRSRYELERVLGRYGASDFALVEADASAAIQFALQGRCVQLALPLPDPNAPPFTHTPSGRPRTVTAQERAYEQALREHWRALLLAVRGKLQSVESGISTFEDEFAGFLVPQFHEEKTARRKRPKAVNWLLGSSHTVAIALVAAFLVPASAVGAFALPPNVVNRLAPFRGALSDELAVPSKHARAVALGQSSWIRYETESPAAERDFAASAPEVEDAEPGSSGGSEEVPAADFGGLRQGAQATGGGDKQGGQSSGTQGGSGAAAGQGGGGGSSSGGGDSSSSGGGGGGGGGGGAAPSPDGGTSADGETSGAEESQPPTDDSALPPNDSETSESGEEPSGSGGDTTTSDPDTDPGDSGDGHDNGNHNGDDNGNHNGEDNGNHNGEDNGNPNGGATGGS